MEMHLAASALWASGANPKKDKSYARGFREVAIANGDPVRQLRMGRRNACWAGMTASAWAMAFARLASWAMAPASAKGVCVPVGACNDFIRASCAQVELTGRCRLWSAPHPMIRWASCRQLRRPSEASTCAVLRAGGLA
jgi:hypothetical protein